MAIEIRCKACGEKCLDTDSYCPHCHESIKAQGKSYEAPIEGIDVELWKKFIGKKSETFLNIFRKNEGKEFFVDFNPYAFIFKSLWFFYRKMYVQGVVIEILAWLYAGILSAFATLSTSGAISLGWLFFIIPFAFAYPVILALVAPLIYRNHIINCINKKDMEKGGTSLAACFVVLIGGFIISSGISDLFMLLLTALFVNL